MSSHDLLRLEHEKTRASTGALPHENSRQPQHQSSHEKSSRERSSQLSQRIITVASDFKSDTFSGHNLKSSERTSGRRSSLKRRSSQSSSRHRTSSARSRRSSGEKSSVERSSSSRPSRHSPRNADRVASGSSSRDSRNSSGGASRSDGRKRKPDPLSSRSSDAKLDGGSSHRRRRSRNRDTRRRVLERHHSVDVSRSNDRKGRSGGRLDPLSISGRSSHARLGSDYSSHERRSSRSRESKRPQPDVRRKSLDDSTRAWNIGTVGVLSENEEELLSSGDDEFLVTKTTEAKKRMHQKKPDVIERARHDKAKSKASMRNGRESVMMQGVQQVSSRTNISTLYGTDTDTKAKENAFMGDPEYSSSPSVLKEKKGIFRGGYGQMRSASVPAFQSRNSAAVSMLHGSDVYCKAKAKAKSSRGNSARELTGTSTLYGSDADLKAKAKACKSPDEDCWSSDEYDYDDHTYLSPVEIADARIKARAAESRSQNNAKEQSNDNDDHTYLSPAEIADSRIKARAAESRSQNNAKEQSNDNDDHTYLSPAEIADARIKAQAAEHRSLNFGKEQTNYPVFSSVSNIRVGVDNTNEAEGRATVETTNPGVERVSLPAFLAENVVDENDTIDPIAVPVSVGGTDSDWTSLSDSQQNSTIHRDGAATENTGVETRLQPNDPETGSSKQGRNDPNRKEDSSRTKCIALLLIPFFLIGGGIAIWIFLLRNKSMAADTQIDSPIHENPSRAPSSSTTIHASSAAPSSMSAWTTSPTTSPIIYEGLIFQPPSESNCEAIAKNETIAGREEMEDADFALDLEVVLSKESTMTQQLVNELLDAIQEKILPSLAGCNIRVDAYVEAWRFVIFDASVSGNVHPDERCRDEDLATQNCHLMSVKLDLFLKGRVRFLDIIDLISDEDVNISNHLGLSDAFSIVKLVQIDNLTPTASPTKMPSDAPSWTPSEMPTRGVTAKPTSLPTATPTSRVSGEPTRTPSFVPTLASSVVLETGIPTATPSPVPTDLPSDTPSTRPSDTPSALPSVLPSKLPSVTPTVLPSALPSLKPSNLMSRRPSCIPSGSPSTTPSELPDTFPPSSVPSPTPSSSPSVSPSNSPTTTPSMQPSVTSFYWVTCGRVGKCANNAATLQRTNYTHVGGIPSTLNRRQIAVRCCADTKLPGFKARGPNAQSCPFSRSEIGGTCYNTMTYHEAENVCVGVGARLCTLEEMENNCAYGSGCKHDSRMAWTSTPGSQSTLNG